MHGMFNLQSPRRRKQNPVQPPRENQAAIQATPRMTPIAESICWLILATCGQSTVAWANPWAQTVTIIEARETGWCNAQLTRETRGEFGRRIGHVAYTRNVFAPHDPIERREWEIVVEALE